jgi:predicted oxidoreductase
VASLERYNTHAARGDDPDFHKQPEFLAAQDKGPWAAFDLSLGKAMYSGFTVGGLATDVDGRVLREDGTVIAGLYAAGACASNLAQDGKGYSSGTQLGSGSFFGRRAGVHAAEVAKPI